MKWVSHYFTIVASKKRCVKNMRAAIRINIVWHPLSLFIVWVYTLHIVKFSVSVHWKHIVIYQVNISPHCTLIILVIWESQNPVENYTYISLIYPCHFSAASVKKKLKERRNWRFNNIFAVGLILEPIFSSEIKSRLICLSGSGPQNHILGVSDCILQLYTD